MFAIINFKSKHFKITIGDVIEVNDLDIESGQTIDATSVLLLGTKAHTLIGRPMIANAFVRFICVGNTRTDKIITLKRTTNSRTTKSHRPKLTLLKASEIHANISSI